ncbi:hypothetical protein C1645_758134, partial [Glomus cerebriforme]
MDSGFRKFKNFPNISFTMTSFPETYNLSSFELSKFTLFGHYKNNFFLLFLD